MNKLNLYKLILPLFLIFSSWAQAAPSFSNVYIFGDSLSDTGNLASVIGAFPAPYYMNRVTNGPVAVDTLAAQLGHTADASLYLLGMNAGSNYSVARATASGSEAIDLATQVLSFQAMHGFIAPSDALYVVFIGGNDVRDASVLPNPDDANSMIMSAANEVKLAIESLVQTGAKSFLLINSPDISVIPETQLIANATSNPDFISYTHRLSKHYNKSLKQVAKQLKSQYEIKITKFNLYEIFNQLIEDADQYGFTNSTDACFSSVTFQFHPDCNFGASFDQFVFFDEIHPSARIHAIVGDAMAEAIMEEDDENEDDDDEDD